MGIRSILGIAGKVAAGAAGIALPPDHRIAEALEEIAAALNRAYPRLLDTARRMEHPPLGITIADNETTVEFEEAEAQKIQSREETLLKEFAEWQELKRKEKS